MSDHLFKKGNPGGPGRPAGSISLVGELKKHLKANPEDVKAVVAKIVSDAIEGDVAARKLILDRIDGAVPQRLNVSQLTDEQLLSLAASGLIQGDGEAGFDPADESEA